MRTSTHDPSHLKQGSSPNLTRSSTVTPAATHWGHSILRLQRMIGNQAVQMLLRAHAEGLGSSSGIAASARYCIADQITRMPEAAYQYQVARQGEKGKAVTGTDTEQAKRKGYELASLIVSGKWGPENDKQLAYWLGFYQGEAWSYFVFGIQDALGEQVGLFRGELKDYPGIYAATTEESVVIPISKPKVARGGFRVAYFAQVMEETSDSTVVEVYNEVYGGAELNIELPIKKVAKFKLGVGVKRGRKTTEKSEEKTASRVGKTISRTFTVKKLEREAFRMLYLTTFHGVSAGPTPQLATEVTRERKGFNPREIQGGYQIVPEEGGEPWGPFWNVYEGYELVEGSALAQVWQVLEAEQRKMAEDLVFRE